MSRQSTSHRTGPSKRRRPGNSEFGAPSEADLPSAQHNIPSLSASSTRTLPVAAVPALSTLCARIFAANLARLSQTERTWEATLQWLKVLPDSLVPKVFAMLRVSCPTILNEAFIVSYFLRGSSVTLTSDLRVEKESTILAISSAGSTLRELQICGFEKFPDKLFADVLRNLPSLRMLVLRGCSKVGPKTVEAASKSCPSLRTVNFNYTAVTPLSLVPLVLACPQLEVLKLAGIPNWTDTTFTKFLNGAVQGDAHFTLSHLHTVKLRQTSLSDVSLISFISLCPNLKRLDISFTAIRRPPPLLTQSSIPSLEKLSLTSTGVASADVIAIISLLPQLKTLALGALGGGQGSTVAMGNSSAMTMNDDTLDALTGVLENFQHLENVSLVGNTKLGFTGGVARAIANFIRRVGRKCKARGITGIPSLRSSDLSHLEPKDMEQGYSPLETLILNNTSVGDEAAQYLSSCKSLRRLEVAGTKFTSAGLFPIIDACKQLENLDLTSCRGVRVTDRRRFFEVWDKEWRDSRR